MKLKTFRAPSMADALAAVKKDLGKDAVILHTRTVKTGGFLGFGAKSVVEITAADTPASPSRRRPVASAAQSDQATGGGGGGGRLKAAKLAETLDQGREALIGPGRSGRPIIGQPAAVGAYQRTAAIAAAPATPSAAKVVDVPVSPFPAAPLNEPTVLPVRERRTGRGPSDLGGPRMGPTPADATGLIQRDLADIKLLVNQVLQAAPGASIGAGAGAMPEALFRHYLRLLESQVGRDIADSIVGAVRDELNPGELGDESIVRTTVLRHLAAMIPVSETVAKPGRTADGRPLTVALVGPTGVGKTTTIAKLAAAYKLRHGKSVALITSDTYRIAAVDQLRTYAGIIGIPLKVVLTPAEMAAAVQSFSEHDVILIDTAGRSQNATDRLAELGEFLDAAAPHETHLVLSTTAAEPVLLRTAEAFAAVKPNRVILTKLDEAVNFGVLVNVARRLPVQLSFVTTGQEVPDHIEPGRPDRLARMILDNGLAVPRPIESGRRTERPETEPLELVGVGPRGAVA